MIRTLLPALLLTLLSCMGNVSTVQTQIGYDLVVGSAYDAAIASAKVEVFRFDEGVEGEFLGEALTDEDGRFEVEASLPQGVPLLVRVSGGTTTDDQSGETIALEASPSLTTVLVTQPIAEEDTQAQHHVTAHVTPWTHIAAGYAAFLWQQEAADENVESEAATDLRASAVSRASVRATAVAQAIQQANEKIGRLLSASEPIDIVQTAPAPIFSQSDEAPTLQQIQYSHMVAALSQLAFELSERNPDSEPVTTLELADVIRQDIAFDGVMQGEGADGALELGRETLTATLMNTDFYQAALAVLRNPRLEQRVDEEALLSDLITAQADPDLIDSAGQTTLVNDLPTFESIDIPEEWKGVVKLAFKVGSELGLRERDPVLLYIQNGDTLHTKVLSPSDEIADQYEIHWDTRNVLNGLWQFHILAADIQGGSASYRFDAEINNVPSELSMVLSTQELRPDATLKVTFKLDSAVSKDIHIVLKSAVGENYLPPDHYEAKPVRFTQGGQNDEQRLELTLKAGHIESVVTITRTGTGAASQDELLLTLELDSEASDLVSLASDATQSIGIPMPRLQTPAQPTLTPQLYGDVRVEWDAVAEATRYDLYRDDELLQAGITESPFVDTDTSAGVNHRYQIRALSDDLPASDRSPVAELNSPIPYAPTGLSATEGRGPSIKLSWSSSSSASGYYLYRDGALLAETKQTSYTDSPVEAGAFYSYRVAAFNDSGASEISRPVDIRLKPAAPTNFTVSANIVEGQKQVELVWDETSGAKGYKVQRDDEIFPDTVSNNFFTDTQLLTGVAHTYQVAAVNAAGQGPFTGKKRLSVSAPAQPTGLALQFSSEKGIAELSWQSVFDAYAYALYRRRSDQTEASKIGTVSHDGSNVISFEDTSTAAGERYVYHVTAVNDGGQSEPSKSTELQREPPAPSTVTVSLNSESAVEIEWNAVIAATEYDLYRDSVLLMASLMETSFVDEDREPGRQHAYQIISRNSAGSSASSEAVALTLLRPGKVIVSSASITEDKKARLVWTAVGETTHYEVFRDPLVQRFARIDASDSAEYVYEDALVQAGGSYQYRIRAVNDAGSGEYSDDEQLTLVPYAPERLSVERNMQGWPELSWNESVGAQSYTIYRDDIALKSAHHELSYVDETVSPGYSYEYSVAAENAGGISGQVVVTYRPAVPAKVQSIQSFLTNDRFVQLEWKVLDDALVYDIYRQTSELSADSPSVHDEQQFLISVVGANYTDQNPTLGMRNTYWVAARNGGGVGAISEAVHIILPPPTPTQPELTLNADSVEIRWESVDGAESYIVLRDDQSFSTKTFGSITETYYIDTEIRLGKSHRYQIIASNEGGSSYASDSAAIQVPKPSQVTDFTATDSSAENSVRLSWQKVDEALGYEIQRWLLENNLAVLQADGFFRVEAESEDGDTYSYEDEGTQAGLHYRYSIVAYNDGGKSTPAEASLLRRPPAPAGFKAVKDENWYIDLSWQETTGAVGYNLYLDGDKLNGDRLITQNAYEDQESHAGKKHEYTLRAVNDAGEGPAASASYTPPLPDAPSQATVQFEKPESSMDYRLSISYELAGGATGYYLGKKTALGWSELERKGTSTEYVCFSRTDCENLWPHGWSQEYRVMPFNESGNTESPAQAFLNLPFVLSATAQHHRLQLQWNTLTDYGMSDPTNYELFYAQDGSLGYSSVASAPVQPYTIPISAHQVAWEDARYQMESQSCSDDDTCEAAYGSNELFLTQEMMIQTIARLQPPDSVTNPTQAGYGTSVAMTPDANVLVVGAPTAELEAEGEEDPITGAVFVYQRSGVSDSWGDPAVISAPQSDSGFGQAVSISEDGLKLAVGAPDVDHGTTLGSILVYERSSKDVDWGSSAVELRHADTDGSRLGTVVRISADGTAIVSSAIDSDSSGANSAWMYRYQSGSWTSGVVVVLAPPDTSDNTGFATTLSINGDGSRIAIGEPKRSIAGSQSGVAYVYNVNNGAASLFCTIDASIASRNVQEAFASAVALSHDGSRMAVTTNKGKTGRSRVRVIDINPDAKDCDDTATPLPEVSNVVLADDFGASLAFSKDGQWLAVGAGKEDGSGVGVNPDHDDAITNSGAIYLFQFQHADITNKKDWTFHSYLKSNANVAGDPSLLDSAQVQQQGLGGYRGNPGSVAISEDGGVVVGAGAAHENNDAAGAVYVY